MQNSSKTNGGFNAELVKNKRRFQCRTRQKQTEVSMQNSSKTNGGEKRVNVTILMSQL